MGDHVVVARQYQHFFVRQQLFCPGRQPVHPTKFVRILFRINRIAIRQVQPANAECASICRNDCLNVACLFVALVAGQATRYILQWKLGKNSHAVVGLLAMRFDIVAKRLNILAREGVVYAFQLLQTDNVRVCLLQPLNQIGLAGFDRIDVECCDLHEPDPFMLGFYLA